MTTAHTRRLAPMLAFTVLLSGCLISGPRPDPGIHVTSSTASSSSVTSSSPPVVQASKSALEAEGQEIYRRYLELEWQLITNGGLGPDDSLPEELAELLSYSVRGSSVEYYQWIHREGVRVSGTPPSVLSVTYRDRDNLVSFRACVDWSGVVMVTDQVPEWRGRIRLVGVGLDQERQRLVITYYSESLNDGCGG